MSRKLVALAALLLVGVTGTAGAAGGHVATKQRVTITATGSVDAFVLYTPTAGALKRDSGKASSCCWSNHFVTRDGQRIEINDPLVMLAGKHGTLEIRLRIEWVDAGNGYVVGTSTWKVVRGTGDYVDLTGGGRGAHAWLPSGPRTWRVEGFVGTS